MTVVVRAARLEDGPAITSIQNEPHETTAIAWTDGAAAPHQGRAAAA